MPSPEYFILLILGMILAGWIGFLLGSDKPMKTARLWKQTCLTMNQLANERGQLVVYTGCEPSEDCLEFERLMRELEALGEVEEVDGVFDSLTYYEAVDHDL